MLRGPAAQDCGVGGIDAVAPHGSTPHGGCAGSAPRPAAVAPPGSTPCGPRGNTTVRSRTDRRPTRRSRSAGTDTPESPLAPQPPAKSAGQRRGEAGIKGLRRSPHRRTARPGPGVRVVSEPGPSLLSADKHSERASAPAPAADQSHRGGLLTDGIHPARRQRGRREAAVYGRRSRPSPRRTLRTSSTRQHSRATAPTTRVPPPTRPRILLRVLQQSCLSVDYFSQARADCFWIAPQGSGDPTMNSARVGGITRLPFRTDGSIGRRSSYCKMRENSLWLRWTTDVRSVLPAI